MKFPSLSLSHPVGLIAVVALSACGGGGDAPAVPTVTYQAPFTQSNAKSLAALGLATAQLTLIQNQLEQGYIGDLFRALSSAAATGSSSPVSSSCASAAGGSGSFTFSQVKAGTYVGFKTNDSLDVTYNACKFAPANVTVNGKFSVVSLGNYANLSATSVVNYRVTTTNFEINSSALRFRSSGVQTAKYDSTVGTGGASDVSVVVGSDRSVALFSTATAVSPVLTWTLSPGMTINAKLTSTIFSLSMNGDLLTTTASGGGWLSFTTSPPLTGPYSTTGLYPTGGTMRAKDPISNLTTETTYQGSTATVKADTNRDGVLDLTFITTAQALGTP